MNQPQITPNTFLHITQSPSHSNPTIIYFITGNPGLISYYHLFLSLLASKLPSNGETDNFQIYGHSLAGFELGESQSENERGEERYYDLEEQICFVRDRLNQFVDGQGQEGGRPKVILIGHSVGTYIAMEVLRRHHEKPEPEISFDITGGIMLFPTVMDIAKSPSGQKLTTLLYFIPQLALLVGMLVRILTFLLPDSILRAAIKFVTRSPSQNGLDTTFAFLKSKRGVRQALHMAADEMATITTDKWNDDIWGVSTSQPQLTKLFFYFGRNDHWVAEQTREEIISVRGKTGGPKMIVCEDGVPHAFCLKHNEIMANKVKGMVRDIVEGG